MKKAVMTREYLQVDDGFRRFRTFYLALGGLALGMMLFSVLLWLVN